MQSSTHLGKIYCFSQGGDILVNGFSAPLSMGRWRKLGSWNSPASFPRAQSASCWSSQWTSFRIYHGSVTEAADDLILKLGNILYNPFPFYLNFNQGLVSILWQICPPVVGRLIPRSAKISLIGSQCAITELSPVNSSQKSPDHLSY